MHSTGLWHQSSTISVWGAPPSSRMSPSTSNSSHVHLGPCGRVSIFCKRDRLLWNEVQLLCRICNDLMSPVFKTYLFTDLLQIEKLICGCMSSPRLQYPLRKLPIPLIRELTPYCFPSGNLSIAQRFEHGGLSA